MKLGADFTFDPDTHLYTLRGRPILSVSQVLRLAGVDKGFDNAHPVAQRNAKAAARRYKRVHRATELVEEQDLDWDCLEQSEAWRVLAWASFLREEQWTTLHRELIGVAYTNGLPYGFTIDRVGIFRERKTVVDIKCGSKREEWWGVQLAAYERGYGPEEMDRINVRLLGDGRYKIVPQTDALDYVVWEEAIEKAYEDLIGSL